MITQGETIFIFLNKCTNEPREIDDTYCTNESRKIGDIVSDKIIVIALGMCLRKYFDLHMNS